MGEAMTAGGVPRRYWRSCTAVRGWAWLNSMP